MFPYGIRSLTEDKRLISFHSVLTFMYLFPSFHDSFSLVTPFGNVDINLDFICSCQCEKDKNTVSFFYVLHVFRTVCEKDKKRKIRKIRER